MEKKRLNNIDLIKGILIISVIVGHFLLGKVNEQMGRYIIYSFHMPVFIAVSGFLVNRKVLANQSFIDLIKKYVPRLCIPWAIAVLVYCTILNWKDMMDLKTMEIVKIYIKAFIKPYYHLWFILGFLAYVFITWIMVKLRFNAFMLILVSLIISLVSKLKLYNIDNERIAYFVDIVRYDFRLYNLFFFIIGMLLKEYLSKRRVSKEMEIGLGFLAITGWVINIYLFFNMFSQVKKLMFFGLNIPLVILLLCLAYRNVLPKSKWIEYIGKNSMAFYLWHVLVKIIAREWFLPHNVTKYYLACAFISVALYVVILVTSKVPIINRLLYGMVEDKFVGRKTKLSQFSN